METGEQYTLEFKFTNLHSSIDDLDEYFDLDNNILYKVDIIVYNQLGQPIFTIHIGYREEYFYQNIRHLLVEQLNQYITLSPDSKIESFNNKIYLIHNDNRILLNYNSINNLNDCLKGIYESF